MNDEVRLHLGEILRAAARTAALLSVIGVGTTAPALAQSPEVLPAPIAESRETAVVRAAERLSPSIVTVNVLQTAIQVDPFCPSFFAQFGFCGGATTRGVPSLGSGFVVDSTGIILTNEHVVRGADRILVTFPDGRDAEATLIGADASADVAVLQIEAEGLVPVPIGSSSDLRIGEWVIAFGNPFGNLLSNAEPTVTVGVTSALNRHLVSSGENEGNYLGMIQTDAAINPGNSGGPLANADGEVVGMNSSIFSQSGGSEGMGFAIPIERALRIAEDIREHGHVRHAWVGIQVQALEADEFGRMRGVRVVRVAEDSPGDQAGIRVGDLLLEVNGKKMLTLLDYQAALLDLRAGDEVTLQMDGGWAPVVARAEELPSLHAEKIRLFGGIEVTDLTAPIRGEFGVVAERGVLVTGITAQFQSALAGNRIIPGDVIIGLNNSTISSAQELETLTSRLQRGAWHRFVLQRNGQTFTSDFPLAR